MVSQLYFEDIETPSRTVGPSAVVDKDELIAFARVWDPLPIHVDEEVGKAVFGSLDFPGKSGGTFDSVNLSGGPYEPTSTTRRQR